MSKEMKELDVFSVEGSKAGVVQLDISEVDVKKAKRLVSDVCTMYLANQKKHTASVKGRSDVSYSKRKQRKQKGSGRARAGHAGSPIWVGGGVAFGPKPRDTRYEIPKKVRRKALRDSLILKAMQDEIVIVDQIKLEGVKTRKVVDLLGKLGLEKSVSIVVNGVDKDLVLSCRNIPKVSTINVKDLNAMEVIGVKKLVVTKDAFAEIEKILAA